MEVVLLLLLLLPSFLPSVTCSMSCDLIESQRVTFVAHCRMINVIFPPS